ncbi:MAG: hypothetical protein LBP19_07285 [Treponema sp.]|nr:hypothetical protein [Treponema sp.]
MGKVYITAGHVSIGGAALVRQGAASRQRQQAEGGNRLCLCAVKTP